MQDKKDMHDSIMTLGGGKGGMIPHSENDVYL